MHIKAFRVLSLAGVLASIIIAQPVAALEWSIAELNLQYGKLYVPSFAGGGTERTFITTFQWANGWKYGDNFFFADFLNSSENDGFNDVDLYAEGYANLSLGKITGRKISAGPVKDVGVILGFNWDADANMRKFLPGVRLSWELPGFSFLNTDFMYYMDGNKGAGSGGAPKEGDGFMVDVNWTYPFWVGEQRFSVEGHVEYLTEMDNELGGKSHAWILAQPQFRWYVTDRLAVGVEWQVWMNKLGDKSTDENAPQLLLVWRL